MNPHDIAVRAAARGKPCPNGCGYVSHAVGTNARTACVNHHLRVCPIGKGGAEP